jgi:preprotein translocase subunit SecE
MADNASLTTASSPAAEPLPARIGGFVTSVRKELAKVTWPTRPELIKATRMIIVLAIVLGVTIGLLDYVLQLILVEGIARIAR